MGQGDRAFSGPDRFAKSCWSSTCRACISPAQEGSRGPLRCCKRVGARGSRGSEPGQVSGGSHRSTRDQGRASHRGRDRRVPDAVGSEATCHRGHTGAAPRSGTRRLAVRRDTQLGPRELLGMGSRETPRQTRCVSRDCRGLPHRSRARLEGYAARGRGAPLRLRGRAATGARRQQRDRSDRALDDHPEIGLAGGEAAAHGPVAESRCEDPFLRGVGETTSLIAFLRGSKKRERGSRFSEGPTAAPTTPATIW